MRSINAEGFPNIVDWGEGQNAFSIIASAQEPNYHFIIQNKLGRSFVDVVENYGPRGLEEVQKIGVQLISAIEHLHSLGHLHCDIKPDNLLYDLERGTNSADL